MGKEGKLFYSSHETEWKFLADFSSTVSDFYRIAVNRSGTLLALVAFSGKKP
jgi:hypothetical protein